MAKSDNKLKEASDSPKMEFESWYAMRESAIPAQHHREILKADFGGQGLKDMATEAEFDKALERYGVALG